MLVNLKTPITLDDGEVVESVFVRVPPRELWDSHPIGVDPAHWNLSHIIALPLSAIGKLSPTDMATIIETWSVVMDQHNAGARLRHGGVPIPLGGETTLRSHLRAGSSLNSPALGSAHDARWAS